MCVFKCSRFDTEIPLFQQKKRKKLALLTHPPTTLVTPDVLTEAMPLLCAVNHSDSGY